MNRSSREGSLAAGQISGPARDMTKADIVGTRPLQYIPGYLYTTSANGPDCIAMQQAICRALSPIDQNDFDWDFRDRKMIAIPVS